MEPYPLNWPASQPRTPWFKRIDSRFNQTYSKAKNTLINEVHRLGGQDLIISTNAKVRLDGNLMSTEIGKKYDDPGVAIYFKRKGKDAAMACDIYKELWENMYALARSIEAMRAIERWGGASMLDRAMVSFAQLPMAKYERPWWEVLELSREPEEFGDAEHQYKILRKRFHPDAGGSKEAFQELQAAFEKAKFRFGKD